MTTSSQDVVVLANPGGGKTALLVERIHHLVTKAGVSPEGIMTLTFTSKAAAELRERVEKRIGNLVKGMWIRTFHSAGLQLIKTFPTLAGLEENFIILDPNERRHLIRKFVLIQQSHHYLSEDELVDQIGQVKNGMVLVADLPNEVQEAFALYEKVLKEQNAIDLDDMIVKALLVLAHPNVKEQLHKRFQHILIDEYQDINSVQEQMVQGMLGNKASRFLVGDPDQTIYEWRGAKSKYMVEHSRNAELVQLTQNFRSSLPIVRLANHIIDQNAHRNKKPMEGQGEDIYIPMVGKFESETAQAQFIASKIKQLVEDKRFRYDEIAILIRSHSQTPSLEMILSEADIPYGGELFWSQPAVKQALSLLEAINQPYTNGNLIKAINLPSRVMDNLLLQDLAKDFEIQHLSTADQLLVLSHLPGKWPQHKIFRQRINSLLLLHKESQTSESAPMISSLISAFDLKEDLSTKSIQLSLFRAIRGLLDLALDFGQTRP